MFALLRLDATEQCLAVCFVIRIRYSLLALLAFEAGVDLDTVLAVRTPVFDAITRFVIMLAVAGELHRCRARYAADCYLHIVLFPFLLNFRHCPQAPPPQITFFPIYAQPPNPPSTISCQLFRYSVMTSAQFCSRCRNVRFHP